MRQPPTSAAPGYLAAAALGPLVALVCFAFCPSFFFWNDNQTDFYPVFIEIGRNLRDGHWPSLILGTFAGGNLIIDWEFGLLNPVTLLICRLLAGARDLYLASLLVSGFYLTMISLGTYRLGRSLGLSTGFALMAAATLATNNYVVYFFAGACLSGLASWCWFLWCWSFLQDYRNQTRGGSLLGYVLCGYLALTSGWPHTSIMLGVLTFAYGIELWKTNAAPGRGIVPLALHAIGLGLLSMPFLLPAFLSFAWTNRPTGFYNHNFLAPTLADVLHGSTLFYLPHMRTYNWDEPMTPLTYLAWFLAPLAPLMRWQAAAHTLRGRWALPLVLLGGSLLLFGPEHAGPLRYPIRGLPYVQAVLLFAFLLAADRPDAWCVTATRRAICLFIVIYSGLMSLFSRPDFAAFALGGAVLTGVLAGVALFFLAESRRHLLAPWITAGVLACFVVNHAAFPIDYELASPGLSRYLPPPAPDSSLFRGFHGYSAYLGPAPTESQDRWCDEMFFAATGLYRGLDTINGYTPLSHRTFGPLIADDNWTLIKNADQIDHLFATEPTTGVPLIDLLRVNRLYIDHRLNTGVVAPFLSPAWTHDQPGRYGTVWVRIVPNASGSTFSWSSPNILVMLSQPPLGDHEAFNISSTRPDSGLVVFARLWWPGYRATLDGRPLRVAPLDDLLVTVEIPPMASGRVVLSFTPPGWPFAWVLFAVGVGMIVGRQVIDHRRHA